MVILMTPEMEDEYDSTSTLEQINSLYWGRRKIAVITDAAKAVAQWEEGHEYESAPVFGKQPQDQSSFMSMRTWPLVFGKQPQDQSLLRT